jgi:arylsulfatase A-like enzyme
MVLHAPWRPSKSDWPHVRVSIAAVAICLSVWGCSKSVDALTHKLPAGPARRAILITCDTLRADHLGCYGYERPTSPCIDALARESIVFENSWSAAPHTLPSISALLAGRPPDEIGAASVSNIALMPASVTTLAEVARTAGFDTAAFVSSCVLTHLPPDKGDIGVQQGFEHYDDALTTPVQGRDLRERNAADTTDAVLRWIDGRSAGQDRFFLWIHYQDPHGPYLPPPEHAHLFVRDHGNEAELPVSKNSFGQGAIPDYQVVAEERRPGQYIDRYDAEIHSFDAEVGRLFDGLRARGLLDDALVVLTADHGESLGEKNSWFCHGETLQRELVRVPLIVRPPNALRPRLHLESSGRHESNVSSYLDV